MTQIVVVEKTGVLKELQTKKNSKEEIVKKYSPKSELGRSGYNKKTTWTTVVDGTRHCVELWATDKGRAGTENKYDFPPPVDNTLLFGSCVLLGVHVDTLLPVNLNTKTWNKIYEKLFGGFEELGSEEPSEDELDQVPAEMQADGYLKDGFVVGDSGEEDNDDGEDEDDEEDAVSASGSEDNSMEGLNGTECNDSDEEEDSNENGSELCSEDYEYSDDEDGEDADDEDAK